MSTFLWCTPECTGHGKSKYEDCVTEALYGWTLDSGQDEETGATDAFGWFAVFHVEAPADAEVSAGTITVPVFSYLLHQHDDGAVTSGIGTREEIMSAFGYEQDRYAAWLCVTEDGGHEWSAGMMVISDDDVATVYAARVLADPVNPGVVCSKCEWAYRP